MNVNQSVDNQVPIARWIVFVEPDSCLAVTPQGKNASLMKLRRARLYVLNDDALLFRNAAEVLHSDGLKLRIHCVLLFCLKGGLKESAP